ncbi:Mrr restriction system protein [Xylanimonas allomyrinae]|uniref:Mrr restriction system protein n=1 Tax=Xylanimonas allomyrinae TaxID=2509459 RepID=A0A4V0YEG9_9MICO|nr:restriction endonuclease [Xylanimonas allomyrinae]QAY64171.1 Mrr restriction system protein [Xylanimonas allomyrinae]
MTQNDLPSYQDFILPAIRAVAELGGSARSREIADHILGEVDPTAEMLALTYESDPTKAVIADRVAWGRSYAKLIGALESPKRGVFLLAPLGKDLLALPEEEGKQRVLVLEREFRRSRPRKSSARTTDSPEVPNGFVADPIQDPSDVAIEPEDEADEPLSWKDTPRARLHKLSPTAFEDFVLYLLRLYGLQLERVGGSGDEGIDGIGTAPISPVLSSRVAVQVKRYDPNGKPVGREVVALFQRDAQTKGAERAILVTLGRFSEPARRAAISTTPTVDLIDGEKLADLVLEQQVGVKPEPVVDLHWFDRFD